MPAFRKVQRRARGGTVIRFPKKTTKPIRYKTSNKAKSSMSLLKIATNVPKSSMIRLRYNQTFLLKGNTSEQYRFRVLMNDPLAGQGTGDIVQEVSGAPVVVTNTQDNLNSEQAELFTQYDHAVVQASTATMSVRPFGANPHTEEYLKNEIDPTNGAYIIQVRPADVHGDMIVWNVLTDRNNALPLAGVSTTTIRNDTPGAKQKSLMCFKNLRKGVNFKSNYNPKSAFGIKDIGDNQTRIGYTPSNGPNEKIFSDYGIQPVLNALEVGSGPTKMPNVYCSFQVDYVIKFTERRPQANTARPYAKFTGEL